MSKIYEKEYLAEIAETFDEVDRRVLLWENPSPTATTMAATTITLSDNLSNYDAYEVDYTGYSTEHRCTARSSSVTSDIVLNQFDANNMYRVITPSADGQTITVAAGRIGSTDNNLACIPRRIWGIQYGASSGDGSGGGGSGSGVLYSLTGSERIITLVGTDSSTSSVTIKTINNESLLGSGNITIQGGGGGDHEEVTQAQYDALTPAEKTDGTVYFVSDGTGASVIVDEPAPIGSIQAYGGSTAPQGWLICDGSAVSRTIYSELFSVIGTTYGTGDGSTTFNVPDFRGRTAQGAGTLGGETYTLGDSVDAGLPNITGGAVTAHAANTCFFNVLADSTGAFYSDNTVTNNGQPSLVGTFSGHNKLMLDASRSSSIYGNSSTVQPNAVVTNYIIKAKDQSKARSAILDLIDTFYPVGSYYETSDATFNPNTSWNGTWVLENEGQVHVSAGSNYVVGRTGGKESVMLSASIGSALGRTDSINFIAESVNGYQSSHNGTYAVFGSNSNNLGWSHSTPVTEFDSSSRNTSIMQPYIVVNRWHRTA